MTSSLLVLDDSFDARLKSALDKAGYGLKSLRLSPALARHYRNDNSFRSSLNQFAKKPIPAVVRNLIVEELQLDHAWATSGAGTAPTRQQLDAIFRHWSESNLDRNFKLPWESVTLRGSRQRYIEQIKALGPQRKDHRRAPRPRASGAARAVDSSAALFTAPGHGVPAGADGPGNPLATSELETDDNAAARNALLPAVVAANQSTTWIFTASVLEQMIRMIIEIDHHIYPLLNRLRTLDASLAADIGNVLQQALARQRRMPVDEAVSVIHQLIAQHFADKN